ncbi:embryonic polarity protein dorsal-like isoform X2 [Toxorhynchites rutilus septentrionalis]|uniref:embryonic polarity protein dorsal-like isoform X2 n=1 Tax=Toxorhynchites rutilus septentrionalis TaxID=329112 RepID=UPI002478FC8D|nr:embryonic polarity protein dorsal-like isoform X2 [Toxorhynchites rutilus septentrionalis]XP_055636525.1 embryonic polarity protein dorsal-like isoform X2 [Toxorhynchites rutilus septentrionalis]XP_055636526.1 embryonic polarity protein dorsal-like isoform X2 [Toxorhynchites rutilus septentrionalis]XP_055636527.1 embryonic polarity protein dorsal-like isoform X2 [Toxorhynchites rutilus septentrionalis]
MDLKSNIVEDESNLLDLPSDILRAHDLLDLITDIIVEDMPPTAPEKPSVVITEQPQSKALRFRYECEGRSAGSIPGVNSTPDQKTFPSIEVRGHKGRAVVVVSCVTKDPPYRPHPHNLVGKEGCRKGVCTVEINSSSMGYTFSNLGIQCVKKKDIEEALRLREEIRVDPFKTGYSHAKQPTTIDLNAVRLCFQVFLEGQQRGRFTEPLQPVVSDVIYDKKAMSDLVICKLSDVTASVAGGKEIILLCEKVAKEDIAVRFYEEQHGKILWEGDGEFQHTNVHKQVAISFRTPRYRSIEIDKPVMVNIQLRRPSDGATSVPLPFELVPLDSGRRRFWSLQHDILKNDSPENEVFKKILLEGTVVAQPEKSATPVTLQSDEVIVLDTPVAESKPIVSEQIPSEQKTTEWIERNEFDEANNNSMVSSVDNQLMEDNIFSNGGSLEQQAPKEDEDTTLNELLEQVAELDEIYTDHQLRRENMIIENELKNLENTVPTGLVGNGDKMDIDEAFDDAATYTSLQRAFKNPVALSLGPPVPPRPICQLELEPGVYDAVEPMIIIPPPSEISSLKRENNEDGKLPPLPPKRAKPNNTQNKENVDAGDEIILHSIIRKGSMRSLTPRPQSDQIIIMKSPDSPPNKKLPPTPPASPTKNDYGTLPKTRKQGFFSKLFSRKKSKSDLSASTTTLTQKGTPGGSKEPSVANFNDNESTRESVRSKSSEKEEKRKAGKPVARSVSSVSCKRPTTESNPDVIYIPLKGDGPSTNLTHRSGSGTHLSLPGNDSYERASTASLPPLDRKAVSALQLDVPIQDGNLELVAIADARSIKNLVEGGFGIQLDPSVDLTEAEHFALYTSIAPNAALSEFDETSCYYAPVEPGPLSPLHQQQQRPNSTAYSADV